MGKTPKEKVNERRRPYNYLRNTQVQGHFSGNETRNYYYSSGSVQRVVPYHRLRAAGPNQFNHNPFRGDVYRDRVSNIPKLGKPPLGRYLPKRKIVSPLKKAPRRKMQSDLEEQKCEKKESTGEVSQLQQEVQSKEEKEEHNLKNGPSENSNNKNEDKEQMENGLGAEVDGSEKAVKQDSENLDDTSPAPKAKSASKDKKVKKNETISKSKGKSNPKPTKDKKFESTAVKKSEKTEIEITEIEVETKDKKTPKKAKKETESHHSTSDHTQPTVKVLRLNTQMLTANAEMNDSSVVEVPVDDAEEKQDALQSTSTARASPRRSTRIQEQKNVQDESIIILQKNDQDESVLVLENESVSVTEVSTSPKDESVSVTEVSTSPKNELVSVTEDSTSHKTSFGEALSSMRGRRSLRPLPPLNLLPRQHTLSSRVPSPTDGPDPLEQEVKTKSFTSIYHKSSKSVMTATTDLTADNDEDDAANSCSTTEESGTEADGTSSEQSADMNMSGKRKMSPMDEVQQELKRFRSLNEEEHMNSTGFLSMISSPMNAFASRIKSGKSSTPVNLVKVSSLADEDAGHLTKDVTEILKEETDESNDMFDKEDVVECQSEAPQRKWCNIM